MFRSVSSRACTANGTRADRKAQNTAVTCQVVAGGLQNTEQGKQVPSASNETHIHTVVPVPR
jgi:hypothetical protein